MEFYTDIWNFKFIGEDRYFFIFGELLYRPLLSSNRTRVVTSLWKFWNEASKSFRPGVIELPSYRSFVQATRSNSREFL